MIFFLFVPTESGAPEVSVLDAENLTDAVVEAESLPYAGRTGYLFDGDLFLREVRTGDGLKDRPGPVPARSRPPVHSA